MELHNQKLGIGIRDWHFHLSLFWNVVDLFFAQGLMAKLLDDYYKRIKLKQIQDISNLKFPSYVPI